MEVQRSRFGRTLEVESILRAPAGRLLVTILLLDQLAVDVEREIRRPSYRSPPVIETLIRAVADLRITQFQRQHRCVLEQESFVGNCPHQLATRLLVGAYYDAAKAPGLGFLRIARPLRDRLLLT